MSFADRVARRCLQTRALIVLGILLCAGESLTAQYYYFGRNKVQYTDFEWYVLQTEHFDIYYYKEMRELAQRGALFAEESYKKLEQKFNHNVSSRIPLIFYSSHLHFQQTNTTPGFIPEGVGGFFEFLKGRVVIPFTGSTEQFAHVIRHELVHVFMHSKVNRVMLDHRQSVNRAPPLWFTEGLAEYWSTEWDSQAEMLLRDAVVNNYVVPLNSMGSIYGSFLMYKEGQAILEYIGRTYGEQSILLLMENFWRSSSFSFVMKSVIGKDYEELDKEWLYHLKKHYYPMVGEQDLPSQTSKTIVESGFNSKPVVHEVGEKRYVYFIGNHTGYTNVYRIDLDQPALGPEAVIRGERSDEFEAFHLFQSKIDISPSGVMVFVTKKGEHDAFHFYDVTKEEMIETIQFTNLVMLGSASWSPDGSKIVFSSIDKEGNNDLYILDFETKNLTRLTNDYYDDRDPDWSPDGTTIVFSSDRNEYGLEGKYNLFLYDLSTGSIVYLTAGRNSFVSPVWSPDGSRIACVSDRDGAQNVWLIEMGRSERSSTPIPSMRKVTNFLTAAFDPSWANDDELVFTVFENYSFQIRLKDHIRMQYDSSASVNTMSLADLGVPWKRGGIDAASVIGEYRYAGKYNIDFAQSVISIDPVFGTAGGASLALSDLLGNDIFHFLIFNSAQTRSEILESFNIAVSRFSIGKRVNHAYGVFRFAGNRYDLSDPELYYYEKAFGGYLALSYPLSKFRRIEASVTISNSDKDNYTGLLPRRAVLVSNSFSFIWDNSLWGPTGPLDGNRLRLTLAYTTDVQYSNVGYYTVIADYRTYLRLGLRTALASRAHLWYNEGREARRFFMGGSWDLRGWPRFGIRGQKIWLTSHELRFPFLDAVNLRFPFGGIGLGSFRGAVFADFGGAWDTEYRETLGSVGFGFRMSIGNFLVLRYDIGKRIEKNLTRFQPRLFYQFFFGWDF